MIKELLINTLSCENGKYFNIEDLPTWASRVQSDGRLEYIEINDKIVSYVAYYI